MEIKTKYGQEIDWNFAFNNMMSKYGKMEIYESVILEKKAFAVREAVLEYGCGFSYVA
jgi:hypothetical protein